MRERLIIQGVVRRRHQGVACLPESVLVAVHGRAVAKQQVAQHHLRLVVRKLRSMAMAALRRVDVGVCSQRPRFTIKSLASNAWRHSHPASLAK